MSVVINGSAGVTTNSGAVYNGIQAGTAVASTSGTSIDFTGIPSWVKRITVMFNGVSTNGTSNILFQLGTSSGIDVTGYLGSVTRFGVSALGSAFSSAGFPLNLNAATEVYAGAITFSLIGSNAWAASGNFGASNGATYIFVCGGSKTLAGTLDRIRITTVNGTDTFDAGSINILYEG